MDEHSAFCWWCCEMHGTNNTSLAFYHTHLQPWPGIELPHPRFLTWGPDLPTRALTGTLPNNTVYEENAIKKKEIRC
jgi:hypothetical protein